MLHMLAWEALKGWIEQFVDGGTAFWATYGVGIMGVMSTFGSIGIYKLGGLVYQAKAVKTLYVRELAKTKVLTSQVQLLQKSVSTLVAIEQDKNLKEINKVKKLAVADNLAKISSALSIVDSLDIENISAEDLSKASIEADTIISTIAAQFKKREIK